MVFHQLTQDEIVTIVDLMLARVDGQLKNKDMGLEVTAGAKALLAKKGYDPVLGARPLRRTIQREIEDNLSEQILFGTLRPARSWSSTPRAKARRRSSRSAASQAGRGFAADEPSIDGYLRKDQLADLVDVVRALLAGQQGNA